MIRSDYLMRQIEQFVKAIAEVIFNKKNTEEALDQLDKIGRNYLGFDLGMIESMTINQLKTLFYIDINQYHMKCFMAAEVLRKKCDAENLNNDSAEINVEIYLKSFELYFEAIQDNKYFQNSGVFKTIESIILSFTHYQIPSEVNYKFFRFHEIAGNFAAAEDILFDLVDEDYGQIFDEGINFYNRLLMLSDDELIHGNLPRKEIIEGMETLKEKFNT